MHSELPDSTPMHRAIELATRALYRTAPNPRVGCVLCNPQGQVIGCGETQMAGGPHAEVMAMRQASELGHSCAGATAYVTLEPCAHHGRTPPCCDALIAAGVARVVVAISDPNPLVAGQGIARMRAAGIEVHLLPSNDALAQQARELNIGFFSRMLRQQPWVRMKLAASLDGTTALDNGASQWITSEQARSDGHAWRARACAVLTGIGTVLSDNPTLDVRALQTPRQPHLVVVDSRLETPPQARLFLPKRSVFIYTASQDQARQSALQAQGATVIHLPDAAGKVDLAAMLRDLVRLNINELHVEAGHKLNGSLIRAALVDEFLVYLAPKLLGAGAGMADIGNLTALSEAVSMHFQSIERIGADLRILARIDARDQF